MFTHLIHVGEERLSWSWPRCQ